MVAIGILFRYFSCSNSSQAGKSPWFFHCLRSIIVKGSIQRFDDFLSSSEEWTGRRNVPFKREVSGKTIFIVIYGRTDVRSLKESSCFSGKSIQESILRHGGGYSHLH